MSLAKNSFQAFWRSAAPLSYTHSSIIPYSREQFFYVVSGVDQYSQFLPWCSESLIYEQRGQEQKGSFKGRLKVDFMQLQFAFDSLVQWRRNQFVESRVKKSNIFENLRSRWWLFPDNQGCRVNYSLEMQFKNIIYTHLAHHFLDLWSTQINQAFEARCRELFTNASQSPFSAYFKEGGLWRARPPPRVSLSKGESTPFNLTHTITELKKQNLLASYQYERLKRLGESSASFANQCKWLFELYPNKEQLATQLKTLLLLEIQL